MSVLASSAAGVRRLEPTGTTGAGTPYRIASLTKPFTALATVLACRDAGVALDTPVLALLPELADDWAAERTITVADLLAQTAGLAPSVSAAGVAALGEGDGALREAARLVVRAGSVRSPGQRWEYYNGNYFLAGAVLAALTGGTFEDAVDDRVLRPWGLAATTFAPQAAMTPYPRGRRPSGGLCSTAADLLTAGERLLGEPDLLAEVARVRTGPADPQRYGLGWAVGPSGQLYLNGRLPGCRAAWLLLPAHDLVGVALAADEAALPAQAAWLSALQQGWTGDDLAAAIDAFAA